MDKKSYALMAILLASVSSVALASTFLAGKGKSKLFPEPSVIPIESNSEDGQKFINEYYDRNPEYEESAKNFSKGMTDFLFHSAGVDDLRKYNDGFVLGLGRDEKCSEGTILAMGKVVSIDRDGHANDYVFANHAKMQDYITGDMGTASYDRDVVSSISGTGPYSGDYKYVCAIWMEMLKPKDIVSKSYGDAGNEFKQIYSDETETTRNSVMELKEFQIEHPEASYHSFTGNVEPFPDMDTTVNFSPVDLPLMEPASFPVIKAAMGGIFLVGLIAQRYDESLPVALKVSEFMNKPYEIAAILEEKIGNGIVNVEDRVSKYFGRILRSYRKN